MRISVVIVTRNRIHKLKRCIFSLLGSTVKPDEILIIDNNSTDTTQVEATEISKKYKRYNIKYFKEKRVGISYARNIGLVKAKSDIIAFTDDDCVVDKDWIKNIILAHSKYPDAIAIGGNTLNYDNGLIGYPGHIYRQFLTVNDFITKANLRDYREELDKNHYMVSLSTQNISYKRKYVRHINFSEHAAPCEAVDFSWKLLHIRKDAILYVPNIKVFHEYRPNTADFLAQHYQYGHAARYVRNISVRKGYFPYKHLTPYMNKIIFYIGFALAETRQSKYNLFKKLYLFALLLSREAAFIIGYVIPL